MQIHDVEQRSPEWYGLRAGLPTASEFSKIVTSTGEPSKSAQTYACTLAAEMFAGRPIDAWEGNSWTERGREMEDEAIRLYEFTHDTEVTRVGFCTADDGTMGCSPDGLVGDDGLAEVKCLKAENHIKAILYYQKHGRCQPDYVQQVQGQLLITGRAWADLILHHAELPGLVIRQTPDEKLQSALAAAIPKLCAERDAILEAITLLRKDAA